jgi:hypothetical protein
VQGAAYIVGVAWTAADLLDRELPPGTPVEAVWEDGAEPGIRALRCFQQAS